MIEKYIQKWLNKEISKIRFYYIRGKKKVEIKGFDYRIIDSYRLDCVYSMSKEEIKIVPELLNFLDIEYMLDLTNPMWIYDFGDSILDDDDFDWLDKTRKDFTYSIRDFNKVKYNSFGESDEYEEYKKLREKKLKRILE